MMDRSYVETVRLLLDTAPVVFQAPLFAMKGGTAINLFVEEMPRLSVDIDVVYLDHTANREVALAGISSALAEAQEALNRLGMKAQVVANKKDEEEAKMFVRRGNSQVKIEVNHVFRGTILPVERRRLTKQAETRFTTALSVPVLAVPELYGSKLVAAMDRQHPRDLFDVRGLYRGIGLTPDTVECFVCYLAGHNKPVHDVLFSRDKDMGPAFENEFTGMAREEVPLDELAAVREKLKRELLATLTANHRQFLLGLVGGEPDWSLMKCPHLAEMPAIRWKLQNLAKLKKAKPKVFAEQADELRRRFDA